MPQDELAFKEHTQRLQLSYSLSSFASSMESEDHQLPTFIVKPYAKCEGEVSEIEVEVLICLCCIGDDDHNHRWSK